MSRQEFFNALYSQPALSILPRVPLGARVTLPPPPKLTRMMVQIPQMPQTPRIPQIDEIIENSSSSSSRESLTPPGSPFDYPSLTGKRKRGNLIVFKLMLRAFLNMQIL